MTRRNGGTEHERSHAGAAGRSAGRWIERHRNSQAFRDVCGLWLRRRSIQSARSASPAWTPFVLRVSVAPCRSAASATSVRLRHL